MGVEKLLPLLLSMMGEGVDMKIPKLEKTRPKCNIVICFGFQCQVFINEMISMKISD